MPVSLRRTTHSGTDPSLKITLWEGSLGDYLANKAVSPPTVPPTSKTEMAEPVSVAMTNGTVPEEYLPPLERVAVVASRPLLPGVETERHLQTPALGHLSDTIERIRKDKDLAPSARRDQISAIERLCRFSDSTPSAVPASVPYIKQLLASLSPASCNISPRSYQNLVSLIRKAMKGELPHEANSASPDPCLTRLWDSLLNAPEDPRRLMVLRRFVKFCASRGLAPGDVNLSILTAFSNTLRDGVIIDDDVHIRNVVGAWNWATRNVPGWPPEKLVLGRPARRFTYDWDAFPLSLREDLDAYLKSRSKPKLTQLTLGSERPARPIKESSANAIQYTVRATASALAASGTVPLADIVSLSVLIDPKNAMTALEFFVERHGGELKSAQTHQISSTLLTIGKLWGGGLSLLPDAQGYTTIDRLENLRDQCSHPQITMTEKNAERLRVLDDPRILNRLLDLPAFLATEAAATGSKRLAASRMQVAVSIEFLLQCPIRIGNLVALDLKRHFVKGTAGPKGKPHLVIPKVEVKNEVELSFEVPPSLMQIIETYVENFRSALEGAQSSSFLFPTKARKFIAANTLSASIARETKKHLGVQLNPHLFRHIAAKLHLKGNPGHYESVPRVLGHKSIKTTTSYYCGQESIAATKHFQRTLLEVRTRGRQR